MADPEVLLSMSLVIITFVLYGLKWAFLIGITIYFCAVVLLPSKYREGRNVVSIKGSNDSKKCSDHSDIEYSFYTENPDTGIESSGYGTRLVRNIVRRNPTLTQELPFNNLQMYKNRQATQSSLRSPEPLLSQVTKHLSFNNTSYYYPDRTNLVLSLSDNSLSSPPSFPKWFNPADTKLPQKSSLLEKTSSFTEERYSPRQFSIVSPSRCNPHNISTVKLSRAGDNDSRFALESILHKRLERTKDNPCSRQSVLSALGQKSRKRSACDSDSSMVESYSVKKRRRDDLDDFLDAVNSPSSAVPYSCVKPIKRSYSDSISEKPTLEITGKRIRENETRSKLSPPLSFVVGGLEDSGVDVNSPTKNLPENVLNQSAKVTQPVKPRKRKSVTFSDKLVNGSEDSSQKEPLTSEEENIKDVNKLKDSPEDYSQVFRIGFSPRKSLAPEYQASITSRIESKSSPRRHRRSNVSWKDLQENRREAWRRSQKLLDEIEESFSKEIASTSPLAVTTISTTTVTSSLTSSLMSSLTSTITSPPASTTSFSSLQTTIDQAKTQSSTATSQSINFLNSGTEQSPFLTAGNSVASNTLFVHTARKPLSGVSSGSSGTTSGFPFASKSSTALFGGISNAPAVSLSAPSLSSTNTSTKANATQSFSIQSLVGSPSTASQPTSSTLSGFRFQTSSSGVSTGSITQTTAPVAQNTIAGPFNTGASSFNVGSNIKTPSFTTTNSSQPKIGGFSFSAPPITKENQTTAPAVSVSGGFTFATEAKEEKKIPQSGFTFSASATEKSSTSGGFSFAATTNQQSSTRGGFSFAAPTTQQSGNSGGFPFAARTTQQSGNSGGFSFVAPTTQQSSTSGGFSFVAPTTQQSSTSGGFSFAASTAEKSAGSGGFTFTAPASSKPNTSGGFSLSTASAGSSGFQFNAPAVNNNNSTFSSTTLTTNNASSGFVFSANNKPSSNSGFNFGGQSTPTTFNFGSSTPAGGFNFAAGFASSTPLLTNSGKNNNMPAKRRPRRNKR